MPLSLKYKLYIEYFNHIVSSYHHYFEFNDLYIRNSTGGFFPLNFAAPKAWRSSSQASTSSAFHAQRLSVMNQRRGKLPSFSSFSMVLIDSGTTASSSFLPNARFITDPDSFTRPELLTNYGIHKQGMIPRKSHILDC